MVRLICFGVQSIKHANVLSEKINFSALGGSKVAIFGRDDLHPLYFYAPPLVPTMGLKLPQQKLKVQEDPKVVLITS